MHTELLWLYISASALLTVSPGPDIVYVMTQSIAQGKKMGFAVSLGLTSGLWIHTALVAFGLSVWIVETPYMFDFIKLMGSLYLAYLAVMSLKKNNKAGNTKQNHPSQTADAFRRGLLMNLLNPKVTLFFMAFFPGFLFHDSWQPITQFFVLGGIFWLQATLIFLGVSYFSNQLSKRLLTRSTYQGAFRFIQPIVYIALIVWLWV